jgi:ParB family transcriptional regulator, chromosome partitioning protein
MFELNLESLDISSIENENAGKPLEIPVVNIIEDENQPRFEFPEYEMNQLAKSIAESGVKTPISVHKHPDIKDKYVINHGHRRYRASILAGKKTVPAFIDEIYNDYDQVMENKERLGHSPLEIAIFIQKK